jgi:hypothetical protein
MYNRQYIQKKYNHIIFEPYDFIKYKKHIKGERFYCKDCCTIEKTHNIDVNRFNALLVFILDKEVLELLEKGTQKYKYDTVVFDYSFIDEYNLINALPKNIKFIEFDSDSYFNKPIDNYPPELEYIKLSNSFDKSIDYLPMSLKYLEIFCNHNSITNLINIPINVEFLKIKINYDSNFNNAYMINNLPDNIKVLNINNYGKTNIVINKLPKNLEILNLIYALSRDGDGVKINLKCFEELNHLTELYFPLDFNNSIDEIKWSDTLIYLSFCEEFNFSIHNLPKNLLRLEVGYNFNIEEHIILADVEFPKTLKTFTYIDGYPKSKDTQNKLLKIQQLYPNIEIIHK